MVPLSGEGTRGCPLTCGFVGTCVAGLVLVLVSVLVRRAFKVSRCQYRYMCRERNGEGVGERGRSGSSSDWVGVVVVVVVVVVIGGGGGNDGVGGGGGNDGVGGGGGNDGVGGGGGGAVGVGGGGGSGCGTEGVGGGEGKVEVVGGVGGLDACLSALLAFLFALSRALSSLDAAATAGDPPNIICILASRFGREGELPTSSFSPLEVIKGEVRPECERDAFFFFSLCL